MKTNKIKEIIKKYWIVPLLILKSFFLAITQLAWGLISLGLLGWVMFFIKKEYPLVNLPDFSWFIGGCVNFILNNITLFFWVFFIVYIYFELKELK